MHASELIEKLKQYPESFVVLTETQGSKGPINNICVDEEYGYIYLSTDSDV